MAFCSNCGAELNVEGRFCPNCGTPVPVQEAVPAAEAPAVEVPVEEAPAAPVPELIVEPSPDKAADSEPMKPELVLEQAEDKINNVIYEAEAALGAGLGAAAEKLNQTTANKGPDPDPASFQKAQQEFKQNANENFQHTQPRQPEARQTVENKGTSQNEPGHSEAMVSLICGIVSCACWFLGISSIISVVAGIIGLIFSANAKKLGNDSNMRKAGFILSLVGLVIGAVIFVGCVACAGCLGCASLNA